MTAATPPTQPSPDETASRPLERQSLQLSAQDVAVANQAHRMRRYRTLSELTCALANSVCNQFLCEQVAVGMVRSTHVSVAAVSGIAEFKASSPGVVQLQQAMAECWDSGRPLVHPPLEGETTHPIHRQWSGQAHGGHVCSIPLGETAVISIQRPASRPITQEVVEQLQLTLEPFAAILALLEHAERPLPSILATAGRTIWNRLRTRRRRWLVSGLAIAFLVICFGRITYRPHCEAIVEAAQLQHMTAPSRTRLEQVSVQAGETVRAGQLLAAFDTRLVELELVQVRAEIERTQVSARAAIAQSDASAAAVQQAHIAVLRAKEAALQRQVESASLRAPSDGVIVASHVEKRLGQVFAQGDPILEFAPHGGWQLRLLVPEDAATEVTEEQDGTFVAAARPSQRIPLQLCQMNGAAQVVEGRNVFVARADVAIAPNWLRSGMRGVATIRTVRKPIWWVAFHRVIDWTRLRFWL